MKHESMIGLMILLATAAYWIYRIREYFRPRSLWEAARDGDLRRNRRLLDERVSPDDLTGAAGSYTPLMNAIEGRHPEAALLLLQRGANPVAVSRDGYSPIYLAVEAGDTAVAEELIRRGASPSWARPVPDWLPIHVAAGEGNAEMIDLLVRSGADPGESDEEGLTPLMIALESGHPEAARKLIELGANPAARDATGRTMLRAAVQYGDLGGVDIALGISAACLDETDRDGKSALAFVCGQDGPSEPDLIRRLLDAGCDPRAGDGSGNTALDLWRANPASKRHPDLLERMERR